MSNYITFGMNTLGLILISELFVMLMIGNILVKVRPLQSIFHTKPNYRKNGLDETKMSLKEVSMPNHLVMKALNLYTAERGVVRDKSNNAIAARNFSIGKMNGLAMRKEYLDQYLSDNNLALVFYSLGEKYIIHKGTYQSIGQRYDLSGAYCYHDNSFDEIQPMHISNTL